MALKENPYYITPHYNLALSYAALGFIDKAIVEYEEYLKTYPDYVGIHVDLGYLYFQKVDYQNAKSHWLTALKLDQYYQPAKDALRLLDK
jgi:tetratricopeptide (TPR) repeat protein